MGSRIDHEKYRNDLLDAVVVAGAEFGLTGITNQTISEISGFKEPYIYRYFLDREDMIKKAFKRSDKTVFEEIGKYVALLENKNNSSRECFFNYMNKCWDYFLSDLNYCRFYIRYYYSISNTEEIRGEHRDICRAYFLKIKKYFIENMDEDFVMHQLFATVLSSVMDIATGVFEDTKEKREMIFDFMYKVISQYLANERK